MSPIAATLEKDDLLPLAAYFSKQKWPNLQQPSAPDDVAAKALTAVASIGCPGCHLDHFQGDGTTARLAGQQQDYLHKTMMDFRDGTRGNNPGMSDLMKATAPDDIAALAQYLAGHADRGLSRPGPLAPSCAAASFSRSAVSVVRSAALLPCLSRSVLSAPRASSSSTATVWLSSAAIISGVRPRLS